MANLVATTGNFDFRIRGDKSLYLVTISTPTRNRRSFVYKSILVQAGIADEAIAFVIDYLYPESKLIDLHSVDELYNVGSC